MTNKKATPPLRLTAYAWAKLLHLRDLGPTEVGGFGISAADDLLLLEDVYLIRQSCTSVTVKFDDEAVADYFDEQVDQGLAPEQFGRIWIHTHPGNSALPSLTDERTFARCFGKSDWAVMLIVACGGQTYVRLRFRAGPGGAMELPVEVDFTQSFPAADPAAWEAEYERTVVPEVLLAERGIRRHALQCLMSEPLGDSHDNPFWDDFPHRSLVEAFDDQLGYPF